jgi:hypothetical protein
MALSLLGACRHHSPEEKVDYLVSEMSDRLDLNPAQIEQLNQIKEEILQKTTAMRESREKGFQAILDEFGREQIDTEHLMDLALDRLDNFEALLPFFLEKLDEFHQLLTPAQREKLLETIEKMKARRGCSVFGH